VVGVTGVAGGSVTSSADSVVDSVTSSGGRVTSSADSVVGVSGVVGGSVTSSADSMVGVTGVVSGSVSVSADSVVGGSVTSSADSVVSGSVTASADSVVGVTVVVGGSVTSSADSMVGVSGVVGGSVTASADSVEGGRVTSSADSVAGVTGVVSGSVTSSADSVAGGRGTGDVELTSRARHEDDASQLTRTSSVNDTSVPVTVDTAGDSDTERSLLDEPGRQLLSLPAALLSHVNPSLPISLSVRHADRHITVPAAHIYQSSAALSLLLPADSLPADYVGGRQLACTLGRQSQLISLSLAAR